MTVWCWHVYPFYTAFPIRCGQLRGHDGPHAAYGYLNNDLIAKWEDLEDDSAEPNCE